MNRKSFLYFVIFAIATLFLGSCKKEDSSVAPNSALSIEQIKAVINANPEQYLPPTSDITDWYQKNSGLKNTLINPIAIYTEKPENWVIYDTVQFGLFGWQYLLPWVITQDEEFVIEGYMVRTYINWNPIGPWEFATHWENPEYFVKEEFTSNLQETEEETQMNLTYKTLYGGTLNFKHSFIGNYSELWLPMMNFSCHYYFESDYTFGGTISFNPYDGNEVNLIYAIQFENIDKCIKIYSTQVFYRPGTSTVIEIFSENIKVEERTISCSATEVIEPTKLIPVKYVPNKIICTVTDWNSGVPEITQHVEYNVVFSSIVEGVSYYILQ